MFMVPAKERIVNTDFGGFEFIGFIGFSELIEFLSFV